MIEVIDRIVDKENKEIVFVKMDVVTYNNLISKNNDITISLKDEEKEILNSKWFTNLDDLFDDLEK